MEERFGRDFSDVRVHDDAEGHGSARALGARAYTVGSNVTFARGEFRPQTPAGRGVLAHELAHVVQQRGAAAPVPARLPLGPASGPAEREAERARRSVEQGRDVPAILFRSGGAIQRLPGSAAGGCGVCYQLPLKDVGNIAHPMIEAAMIAQHAFLVPRHEILNIIPKLGSKGIPDLMDFSGPDTVAIGEIKPNSPSGLKAGHAELNVYDRQLRALGMKVTRMNWPPPLAPLPFPTNAVPSATCPATHNLYVDAPVKGLYSYWCSPDFKELRPRCKCKGGDKPPAPPVPVEKDVKEKRRGRDEKDVKEPFLRPEDVLVPLGVAAALLLGAAARKRIAAGLAKKSAGRALAYAEAAAVVALLVFYSDRVQAAPGGSDELALEALFRAMKQKGAPIPPGLAKRITADPELKSILEGAAKSGDYDAAKAELHKKMLKLINDHPEEFTDEDLRILMSSAQVPGRKTTTSDPTVESLRKAIERARRAKASAGAKEGEAGKDGKGAGPGLDPPANQPPKDVPGTKYPALSPEVQKQLDAAPAPVRFVLQQLLGQTKGGAKLDDVAVQRFLATVPANLTQEEAGRLARHLVSAKSATLDRIMLSLAHAVRAIRTPATERKPADPAKSPPAPGDPKKSPNKEKKGPGTAKEPGDGGKAVDAQPEKGKTKDKSKQAPDQTRRKMIQILRAWKGWGSITPSGNRFLPVGEGASFDKVGSELLVAHFRQVSRGDASIRMVGFFLAKIESKNGKTVVLHITGGGQILADDGSAAGRAVGAFTSGTRKTVTLIEEGAK